MHASELWLAGGNLSSSLAEIPSPRLIYKYTNKQIKNQKKAFLIPPSEATKRSGSNETADAMAVALTRRDETGPEGQPRADRRYELEGKVGSRASPSRACVRPVVHMAGPHLPVMSLPFDLIFALTMHQQFLYTHGFHVRHCFCAVPQRSFIPFHFCFPFLYLIENQREKHI